MDYIFIYIPDSHWVNRIFVQHNIKFFCDTFLQHRNEKKEKRQARKKKRGIQPIKVNSNVSDS